MSYKLHISLGWKGPGRGAIKDTDRAAIKNVPPPGLITATGAVFPFVSRATRSAMLLRSGVDLDMSTEGLFVIFSSRFINNI